MQKSKGKTDYLLLITLIIAAICTDAGNYINSNFTTSGTGSSSSNVITANGLALDYQYYATVKIDGDTFSGMTANQVTSDVVARTKDTLTFFYGDSVNKCIYFRDYALLVNRVSPLAAWAKLCDADLPQASYLHADRGATGNLVSFIHKGIGNSRYLRLSNGTKTLNADSAMSSGWLFSTQCALQNDTFLVAYSLDMSSVRIKKVYSKGTVLNIIASATVATGSPNPGNSLMNCTIAFDGAQDILVGWVKGTPTAEKYFHFKFLDRAFTMGAEDSLAQKIGTNDYFYYDDVAAASYYIHKFGIVFWNENGLNLTKISRAGNTIQSTTTPLIVGKDSSFCSVVSNKKYFLIVAKADLNNDNKTCIEGIRYTITNGELGASETLNLSELSNDIMTKDQFSTAINCAMDTAGSIGVTWKNYNKNQQAIWGYRGVRYKNAFWRSAIDSLNITFPDSNRFFPVKLTVTDTSNWDIERWIRTGCTITQCTTNNWILLTDESQLRNNKSVCKYFQYRIGINRKDGKLDSLDSPLISQIEIPYNIQPVIIKNDSVYIRSKRAGNVLFSDTLNVLSRIDTITLYTSGRDQDTSETVSLKASWPSRDTTLIFDNMKNFSSAIKMLPISRSDTIVRCSLVLWDARSWYAQTRDIYLKTRNSIPEMQVNYRLNEMAPVMMQEMNPPVVLQEKDSIVFNIIQSDTNDPGTVLSRIQRIINSTGYVLDSLSGNSSARFCFRADTVKPVDSVRLQFSIKDIDYTGSFKINLLVNHAPKISKLSIDNRIINKNDTVGMRVSRALQLNIAVQDTDIVFWDTLKCLIKTRYQSDSVYSLNSLINMNFIPNQIDSQMTIIVSDRHNKSDTMSFFIKTPWLSLDSTNNRTYFDNSRKLRNDLSLICKNPSEDITELPLVNIGNDSMKITGCKIVSLNNNWLKVVIKNDTVTSGNNAIKPFFTIAPAETIIVKVIATGLNMIGDKIITDTIMLFTDDAVHDTVIIPVSLEHNDLPQIIDVMPNYEPFKPILQRNKKTSLPIFFPPHAAIQISFSEPVDSASADTSVFVYSKNDYKLTGDIQLSGIKKIWSQNYTKLDILSNYTVPSPFYSIKPVSGLFIPTDSIVVSVTNGIMDRALTPHGPNRLDINKLYRRINSLKDTVITFTVDSITFTLLSVTPNVGDSAINDDSVIVSLNFSSDVFASSVDTSKVGNKTLVIKSKYADFNQLTFDSIFVIKNQVFYKLGRRLFFNDSLICRFNSKTIRDAIGYTSDNNRNGIPSGTFDTMSIDDDVNWGYKVKTIRVVKIYPESLSITRSSSPEIAITFSSAMQRGTFDTSLTKNNRSFQIGSIYSNGASAMSYIRFSADSTTVYLQPKNHFFSNDSIYCRFFGFSTGFRYANNENLPIAGLPVFGEKNWSFHSGDMGFYTYPNPYKPGTDPRHCRNNGPCGIWFKNLHVLKKGINAVRIIIYDINANPVFDSKKRNQPIHFETNTENSSPEWLWNTRNNKNQLVASGLYIYVIFDIENHVLVKDKIIIAR
jgi:hypothetical protein